jgi:hypothetical protein
MTTDWKYLPILKWKLGERTAVRKMTMEQWTDIVVLIEPLPIDSAPDPASLRAALKPYVAKLSKEIAKAIPIEKPIAVDTRYVAPGYAQQLRLLMVVCGALQAASDRRVLPVLTEAMVAKEAGELARHTNFEEVFLRININSIDPSQIQSLVELVCGADPRKRLLHLVLDQESIVNVEPPAQGAAVLPYLDAALSAGCASTTLAGGSFPVDLIGIKQGSTDLRRSEWEVWKRLSVLPEYSALRYSDYTVSNPAPIPQRDPKMINPSVAIRYAADGFWRVYKAGGFKKGKPNQYRSLCQLLLTDSIYSGAGFSWGDDCYEKAATAKLGNGNPSSWRRDATSHHLVWTASAL